MIDEYFSSNPQAKWAAIALLAVYIWFMVLGPFMKLFTYDPNKDHTLEDSRSRWFLQLLIGLVPLVLVGYNWYKASNQPPPPPVEKPFDFREFESKLDVLREKIVNPQVVYLPYPSTATPVGEPKVPEIPPPLTDVPEFPLPNKK